MPVDSHLFDPGAATKHSIEDSLRRKLAYLGAGSSAFFRDEYVSGRKF